MICLSGLLDVLKSFKTTSLMVMFFTLRKADSQGKKYFMYFVTLGISPVLFWKFESHFQCKSCYAVLQFLVIYFAVLLCMHRSVRRTWPYLCGHCNPELSWAMASIWWVNYVVKHQMKSCLCVDMTDALRTDSNLLWLTFITSSFAICTIWLEVEKCQRTEM